MIHLSYYVIVDYCMTVLLYRTFLIAIIKFNIHQTLKFNYD